MLSYSVIDNRDTFTWERTTRACKSIRASLIVLLLCLLFTLANAQPQLEWAHVYDAGASGMLRDVFALQNGDFAACGFTGGQLWIIRVDARGQAIWSNLYEGTRDGKSLIETDDGDIVVGGSSEQGFTALRVSGNGEQEWLHTFDRGSCNSVIELKDGNLAFIGYFVFRGEFALTNIPRLVILSAGGETILNRTYGELGSGAMFCALREREDGLVISGIGGNVDGPYLLRVDMDGAIQWFSDLTVQSSVLTWGNGLVSSEDGGFALFGLRQAADFHGERFLLTKTNERGGQIWSNTYVNNGEVTGYGGVTVIRGVGFLMGASLGDRAGYTLCVNQDGEPLWSAEYDDPIDNAYYPIRISSIIQCPDGAEIASGYAIEGNDRNGRLYGFLMRLERIFWEPVIFNWSPHDTVQTVLQGDSLTFIIRSRDQFGREMQYEWWEGDSLLSHDTTTTISFENLGIDTIQGRVIAENSTSNINWFVTVRDLFIVSYSPDNQSIDLRRGATQSFSLDTVRAIEGDAVEYQWTLTNLNNFEREDAGGDAGVTVDFLRSGNYQMEGLAYRGESSDNVIWTIAVRSAILDFWPRSLRLSVPPDSSGEFGVIPFNPESDSLTYRWELDGDSVGSDSTVTLRFALDGFGNPSYQVSAIVMDGAEGDTVTWEVTVMEPDQVGKSESPKAEKWGLLSVSPNPFNSMTTIRFSTGSMNRETTRLGLYSLDGRLVQELVNSRIGAGEHSCVFNGENLGAGIYLLRLKAGGVNSVSKIVLTR